MDVLQRIGIIDKLNDKSRLSENGECIMWTGFCKGWGVRYEVMCVNVSLHGSMWKSMYVHRLYLQKDPTNLGLEILHL